MSSRGDTRRLCAALLAASLLGGLAAPVRALPEDRDQPIRITADKAVRDEKQGFTVYQGNVEMQQGSLRISAGKITVFHATAQAERILAEGSPAHMQQQPEPEEALMHARAQRIEYFKDEERVLLQRNASIEQEGSTVTGDSIEYFIAEQLVRADSSGGSANERVEVVIPARQLEAGEAHEPAADAAPQTPQTPESSASETDNGTAQGQ